MLNFIDDSDFSLVEQFKENIDGSVQWFYQNSNGILKDGFTRTTQDENGDEITIDVWAKYCELRDNGTIAVQPVPQAELDAIAAEQAKQTQDALKRTGAEINGHTISLTEENQNGLAAVMQGAQLADEAGASIFPLSFNARTESGETSIPFTDMTEFKAFCLAFLQARQQFF